ncbi:MAG: hypothetical protein A2V81_02510 [Candidatus Abawacabacteria bacterium RBG_16_42_10]|uniref:Pseudouridine synthase n=1 Tax=Candidatus Abawacabacteria bacterium RBG_16_42_10 TaxID=1817814 RepID=A0A1F4XLD6_9BACT|nr:MAG: hypothetical protein A2V81_02510 [Candidatus Abawacabacteria bacterium RBG_16_42_10]
MTIQTPLPEKRSRIIPEEIPLQIIFEDQYVIAINKKPGIVVHPGVGHTESTMIHALEDYRLKNKLPEIRLLHRLDKDTSGILLVSKDESTYGEFSKMFEERKFDKVYLALVLGTPKSEKGYIDAPIARSTVDRQKFAVSMDHHSRRALTAYKTIDYFDEASLLAVKIHTGRTHQIRVHLESIKHPVLGDSTYGNEKSLQKSQELSIKRQMLHAYQMSFIHPVTKKQCTIKAPLPYDFKKVLSEITNTKYKIPSFTFSEYDYHHKW